MEKDLAKISIEENDDGKGLHVSIRGNRIEIMNLLANLVCDMKKKRVLSKEAIENAVEVGLSDNINAKDMLRKEIKKMLDDILQDLGLSTDDKEKENN